MVDLSGLGPGTHTVPVQVQVDAHTGSIGYLAATHGSGYPENPCPANHSIQLITQGEPAVGFVASTPTFERIESYRQWRCLSLVERVRDVRAVLDMAQVRENISRSLSLVAVDVSEQPVVLFSAQIISVNTTIWTRGGYRNVVVKVSYP